LHATEHALQPVHSPASTKTIFFVAIAKPSLR